MSIFGTQQLIAPTFFQKLFKKPVKENFLREINNLLANNENDFTKISNTELSDLVEKYKIRDLSIFEDQFKSYFIRIVTEAIKDEVLTDEEVNGINSIKKLLNIPDSFVNDEIEKAVKEIYKKRVDSAISDGFVTDQETEELDSVRRNLRISEEQAKSILNDEIKSKGSDIYRDKVRKSISDGELTNEEKVNLEKIQESMCISKSTADYIYAQEASSIYNNYLNKAISDQRLSPDEDKELEELVKKLGVSEVNTSNAQRKLLDKYRLYWVIENGEVPTIESDVALQRGEQLYFKTHIDWNELRTVTTRVSYAGVSTRIRICKGVYFRTGTGVPQRTSQDVYKVIDSGEMYLTNKRIIFMGSKSNKTIRLNKILSFSPYSDGVEINKDTGKSPFFAFSKDIELFSLFLSRAINDC